MGRWGTILSKKVRREKGKEMEEGESRAVTFPGLRRYAVAVHLIHRFVLLSWEEPAFEENLIPVLETQGCRGAH